MAAKPPKALQDEWDAKLKASGFEDIEDRDSPREMLKSWHSTIFINKFDSARFAAKQKYFEMVTHFLNAHTFTSDLEHQVWLLHSEGKSLREIARETGKVSKDGALKIIRKLLIEMRDRNTDGH